MAGVEAGCAGRGPDAFGSRLADWQGDGDREERWRARLGIAGSFNVVAVLDGQPVAMASGVPEGGAVARLISMWVSPSARGQGAGGQLVAAVEGWARQTGATELRLDVAPDNERAAALYRRNGFTFTQELGGLMPDGVRREHVMVKKL